MGILKHQNRNYSASRIGQTILVTLALQCALAISAYAQASTCIRPEPVCKARSAVFAISAFDPLGSAARISDQHLVTSRHVIGAATVAELFLADGSTIKASVVPTDYTGDVVLLSAPDLPPGPTLQLAEANTQSTLFVVGADISRRRIRAYRPGRVISLPANSAPLARLHHSAPTQRGNSGGALVNSNGQLVGIVASGGDGRFEAVPATAIATLQARSGPLYAAKSKTIGTAIQHCALQLDEHRTGRGALTDDLADKIKNSCRMSGNRQYYDLAAQILARRGHISTALDLFEASLNQDPNALNTRLSLAIAYHLAGRYEDEIPLLTWLMQHLPDNLQVLRLAIQAGIWGNNPQLADQALAKLKIINPQTAPAAERFIKAPPPRPKRRN